MKQFNSDYLASKELEILTYKKPANKKITQTQRRPSGPGFSGGPGGFGFPVGPGSPGVPPFPGGPNVPNIPGFPGDPGFGFPNTPVSPNIPNFPGNINFQPPSTPPPSNAPVLPRDVVMPLPESAAFNQQRGNVNRTNQLSRGFRQCLNQFTFIWLWTGRSFWFYPVSINRWSADGFAWRGNRWVFERVNLNSIFFFRCFS